MTLDRCQIVRYSEVPIVTQILTGKFYACSQNWGKVTISFIMSTCLSVGVEQLGSHWMDVHGIWYLCIFGKSVKNNIL